MITARGTGGLFLNAPSTFLPDAHEEPDAAVRRGVLTDEEAREIGVARLPVSTESGPELAVGAARTSLQRAGVRAHDVTLCVFANVAFAGHWLWSPAHFLGHRLDLRGALPLSIGQVCNGAAAGLELADMYTRDGGRALVTTGDVFPAQHFERWTSDFGVVYGDGGCATVVSREVSGPSLEVLSLAHCAEPEFELMHRGSDPLTGDPALAGVVDARRTKRTYFQSAGMERFTERSGAALASCVTAALDAAGVTVSDLNHCEVPRLTPAAIEKVYAPTLRDRFGMTVVTRSENSGHLGAGDFIANAAAVIEDNLPSGSLVLSVSAGAGFTWSSAVLRVC